MILFRDRVAALVVGALALAVVAFAAPAAQAHSGPESFADLAAKLSPAVVNVSTTQKLSERNQGELQMPQLPPGSPFEEFFKEFFDKQKNGNRLQHPVTSLGSGFIIDPSGIIVTNNHVIADAQEIKVIMADQPDQTGYPAKLIATDEKTDVALLKIDAKKPLPYVTWGDSDRARVGDWVLAIGNPFGFGGTVTAGIVSARGRDIRSGPYDDFIQTDASINKGNSGGPLFNADGEVIGINTAIISPSGGSIGIGFSIPSALARPVVEQLLKYGHARRGWLGVRIQPVTPDIAESLGLHDTTGSLVASVVPGGPAEAAKIQNGDIILKFNGQEVKENHALPLIVAETAIGTEVPVTLLRDGKELTVTAKVGELPDDQQVASAEGKPAKPKDATKPTAIAGLGLSLAPITPESKDKYQLGANQKGVVVTDVAPD
ncbi:MAG TPA: Do family serine endopeptidase, partial [Candidatus Sulfotelmatobacter sp.]|nr:Do family serine endopeptidase [Candidatus Sulfotelmatobacter sp.]